MEVSGQLHAPAALPPGKENDIIIITTTTTWNMKFFVISIITGDTRNITEGLKKIIWKQYQQSSQ